MTIMPVKPGDPGYNPATIGDVLGRGMPSQLPSQFPGMTPPADPVSALRANRPHDGWRRILGIIGDAMLGAAGQPGVYAPHMMQLREAEQERERREQEAGMKREADYGDFVRREQYKAAHPAPVNNDTINDFEWYSKLTPEQRRTYREMHPIYRIGPDGLPYPMDATQTGAPPPETLPADFDFGGGGTPSGNPLTPPQRQQTSAQPDYSSAVFDQFIKLYGLEDGTRRYLQLTGAR